MEVILTKRYLLRTMMRSCNMTVNLMWPFQECGFSEQHNLYLESTLRNKKLVHCDEFDPSSDRVGCNRLYDVSDQVKHE